MKRNRYKKNITSKLVVNQKSDADKMILQLEKEVTTVNIMLDKLKRRHKIGTWSTKILKNELERSTIKGWSKSRGRVRIPKGLNKTQMLAMLKSLGNFKRRKTSTNRGIKSITAKTQHTIAESLSSEERELTDEEAEFFYKMLGDEPFDYFADKMPSSDVWQLIQEAIEMKSSVETFTAKLLAACGSNDVEDREMARKLYDKYVMF